ncbi:MAG: trypsin-like serine protease [Halobacteria archaeon]|nr:trypsin-like serine protease [Halobacteria archaeon]
MQVKPDNRSALRFLCSLPLLVMAAFATAASPTSSDDVFTRGWTAFEAGHYEQAHAIWLPLAQQGDSNAQINLGFMYDYGRGVDQDTRRAADWYQRSAEGGLAAAQFNLGLMYAEGRGVEQSPVKASFWFQQAAGQGRADAQYALALHLRDVMAVPQQSEAVQRWLRQAAAQGHGEAQVALKSSPENSLQPSASHAMERDGILDRHDAFSAGTAWPIASGYAITNNHVVADVDQVSLIDVTGKALTASVVLRDEIHDLAVLGVAEFRSLPPALPLASKNTRLGSGVFTIGYPRIDVMGTAPKLTDGIISSVNGFMDDPGSYQVSVPIQPGNSGGPLLNMEGEVVGVVASMLGASSDGSEPHLLSNVSYAVKTEVLRRLLQHLPQQQTVLQELPGQAASLADLAERVQESVLIVMVAD